MKDCCLELPPSGWHVPKMKYSENIFGVTDDTLVVGYGDNGTVHDFEDL